MAVEHKEDPPRDRIAERIAERIALPGELPLNAGYNTYYEAALKEIASVRRTAGLPKLPKDELIREAERYARYATSKVVPAPPGVWHDMRPWGTL